MLRCRAPSRQQCVPAAALQAQRRRSLLRGVAPKGDNPWRAGRCVCRAAGDPGQPHNEEPGLQQEAPAAPSGGDKHRGAVLYTLQVLLPAYILGTAAQLLPCQDGPAWLPASVGAIIGALFVGLNCYAARHLWTQPRAPLRVVITGGSRGLGKAMAREFMRYGDAVVISARSEEALQQAAQQLAAEGHPGAVHCAAADVSNVGSVEALGARASQLLGGVDALIINAGVSGTFRPFVDAPQEQLGAVVRTNLLGCLLCVRQAVKLGQQQQQQQQQEAQQGTPGPGPASPVHVFSMEGAGSDGQATPGYAAYGATKAALAQLQRSLEAELGGSDSPVALHTLSPGMVLTDLLLEGATTQSKQFFNILAEQPETVAAYLVPRIRSVVARRQRGTATRYLTLASALLRFLSAPGRRNRFFDAEGQALFPPEAERIFGRYARATARAAARARSRGSALNLAFAASITSAVAVMVADANHILPWT